MYTDRYASYREGLVDWKGVGGYLWRRLRCLSPCGGHVESREMAVCWSVMLGAVCWVLVLAVSQLLNSMAVQTKLPEPMPKRQHVVVEHHV